MLPIAVALTAALVATSSQPAPPRIPAPPAACHDMDPGFVVWVAPPRRSGANPLLWLIGGDAAQPARPKADQPVWNLRSLDFRPAIKARELRHIPLFCGRVLPVEGPPPN
jgi:hypothetical protein